MTKVVLFLVDCMRSDAIAKSNTPTMDRLIQSGITCLDAKTVMPSVTLPCHTSLFFSSPPERHGILTNIWHPMVRPIPGLFDVLHQKGLHTASFNNWEQLRDLSSPGSLDYSLMGANLRASEGKGDFELVEAAVEWMDTHPYDFVIIYLGQTDEVGHHYGWMSDEYLESIHYADIAIQRVTSLPEDTIYFGAADNGGHDHNHGTNSKEDMTIPLIIHIPCVTSKKLETASIIDIAPSIAGLFGVEPPDDWEGNDLLIEIGLETE